jgi:hypothetical protein
MVVLLHGLDKELNYTALRAQLRDRAVTCPSHTLPVGI